MMFGGPSSQSIGDKKTETALPVLSPAMPAHKPIVHQFSIRLVL